MDYKPLNLGKQAQTKIGTSKIVMHVQVNKNHNYVKCKAERQLPPSVEHSILVPSLVHPKLIISKHNLYMVPAHRSQLANSLSTNYPRIR